MSTKHQRLFQTFADLGFFGHVMEETEQEVEFVCLIYGDKKCKSVDKLRAKILHLKFKKQKTVQLIVTTMLMQSGIPHPTLELCGKPVFRGKPIDDATQFSFVTWMDYKW